MGALRQSLLSGQIASSCQRLSTNAECAPPTGDISANESVQGEGARGISRYKSAARTCNN